MDGDPKLAAEKRILDQTLRVDFRFPVIFTSGIFQENNALLAEVLSGGKSERKQRVLVVMDSGAGSVEMVRRYLERHGDRLEVADEPVVLEGGEGLKNDFSLVLRLVQAMAAARLCRHSFVVAVGGGALLDVAGLAAGLVHRGVRLVRIPTTVLSQCDSGVGVKNGVNYGGQKNFLGTFAPPYAVINDFSFLQTLKQEDWMAGVAEAFKVAIIRDADFFEFLVRSAKALAGRDWKLMEEVIQRCAELHLDHIQGGGDPFEMGTARPLDFGHWAAHELERATNWKLGHGQAVAMGVALDSRYACRKGWLNEMALEQIEQGLRGCGFQLSHPAMKERGPAGELRLLRGMETFREHMGGELNLTFPRGIGAGQEVRQVDLDLMGQCLTEGEGE